MKIHLSGAERAERYDRIADHHDGAVAEYNEAEALLIAEGSTPDALDFLRVQREYVRRDAERHREAAADARRGETIIGEISSAWGLRVRLYVPLWIHDRQNDRLGALLSAANGLPGGPTLDDIRAEAALYPERVRIRVDRTRRRWRSTALRAAVRFLADPGQRLPVLRVVARGRGWVEATVTR